MHNLIEETLVSSLQEQIGHEKYNANLYLYIACLCKNKGLNNLGKKFEEQHNEETLHAKMICDLLVDLGAPVAIPEIEEVSIPFENIIAVGQAYLDREVYTTQCLDDIKKLAIESGNPVVEEFMREMIKLQRNEYEEATDFMDKAEIVGTDWKWVLLWDLGLS